MLQTSEMAGGAGRGVEPAPGIEVPFLVNNQQKWISGIVDTTTCGDIVKASSV